MPQTPSQYYAEMAALARQKRSEFGVQTHAFGLREMRSIYRQEEIQIDLWPFKLRKLRAAYFISDGESSVMLSKSMPMEPKLFSLAHELKHHFADRNGSPGTRALCADDSTEFAYDKAPVIEIGAGVFAAEFIFPEAEFVDWAAELLPDSNCKAEDVVNLKRNCPAKVSYAFVVKRLERLRYVKPGTFSGVKFAKLEESLYGVPWYKRRR